MTMVLPESKLTKKQKKMYGPKPVKGWGTGAMIKAEVRHDDECGNGHNTFSITADIYIPGRRDIEAGGCMHDEVARYFPELAPFIKWHLVSTDGPMHYVGNTVYHAGDRDCNGLRKGEKRQIKNGKTGLLAWHTALVDKDGNEVNMYDWTRHSVDANEKPADPDLRLVYVPWCITGEGKIRELRHARGNAVWPEATDEELTAPGLKERLEARLPKLMEDFKAAVESLGFVY